ncbi:hypothetical protein [Myxococcus sp. AS-1-15]|uniref:hypothetical protein n=1 Tax=Myxococcus sp. AS-1-15 TaxID=2874600 RepID=UPI001CBEF4D8|nr:hypothetical protein [Myxococcus sp. AS-1-15]
MPSVRLLLVPLALTLGHATAWAQAPVVRTPPPEKRPWDPSAPQPAEQVPAPSRNDSPDDTSWTGFPGAATAPTGPDAATLPRLPEVPPLVPVPDDEEPVPVAPSTPRIPEPPPGPPPVPNRVSLLGARSVGPGGVAVGLSLGFPVASVRAALGVLPRVDVLAGFDTLYGMMNEPRLGLRWTALDGGPRWSLGLVMEGSHAFFLRSASLEDRGARYLSGRRNWNLMPGLVGTFQLRGPRATRFFADVRYHVALDTEPIQRTPLGGLPPDLVSSGSVPVRLGAEVPLSEKTSYSVSLGGDFRSRPEDATFMPVVSIGIVTGL